MEFSDSYNGQLYSEPSEEYLDGLRTTLSKADPDAIRGAASIETLEDLIQHCLDTEKFADALRVADALAAFIPYSGEVWQRRGVALHALEREKEAMESFARALALNPADEELLVQVAETYCDNGDFDTAEEYLNRALALNPANEDALWNKALMMEREGKTAEAASLFRSFERSERYGEFALSELAACSDSAEDFERAVAYYEKHIAESPFNAGAWYSLGLLYMRRKMHQKAIEQFDMALAIKDDFSAAWFNRGNALALINKLNDAIESYKSGLAHEPHDIPALHNMGNTYLELGRTRDALRYFSLALKFEPHNVESLYGRGCCYDELEQYDKALADFDAALSLENNDGEIWYAKADVEYNLGRIKNALVSYRIATEKNPDDFECVFDYAETLSETGADTQALALFERCAAHDPNWAEAHLGMAKTLIGLKRIEAAAEALAHALAINPILRGEFKADYPETLTYSQLRKLLED